MGSPAEWLDQSLQRRGPGQELPYDSDVRWNIRQHLLDLVAAFPTLVLKVQNYTHTDGRVAPLFVAEGTLPMFYQGVKYNIPVAIWLPEKYPRVAPIMYVVPTSNMMIKPHHTFVTPSGVVNSEYLRHWTYRSSLEVLGHDTSIHFGQEPPLFQKPPNTPTPDLAHNQHQHTHQGTQQVDTFHNPINRPNDSSSNGYGSSNTYAASNNQAQNPAGSLWGGAVSAAMQDKPQHRQQSPSKPKPRGPDLKGIFRESAVRALSDRLTASITAANEKTARETDQLFEEQAELGRRSQQLDAALSQAQGERSALETRVLELTGKTTALERWNAENEAKSQQEDVDPDAAIVASDTLSRQALDAQAEDLALEDCLYSLNKALQEGILTPETYMKQVRNTCHKQFFVRALGAKVAQKQHDMRRNAVNPHYSPPSVQMPQGDSWSNPGVLAS